jgi:hypothetical protein
MHDLLWAVCARFPEFPAREAGAPFPASAGVIHLPTYYNAPALDYAPGDVAAVSHSPMPGLAVQCSANSRSITFT